MRLIAKGQKSKDLRYFALTLLIPFLLQHSNKAQNGTVTRKVWNEACSHFTELITLSLDAEVTEKAKELDGF